MMKSTFSKCNSHEGVMAPKVSARVDFATAQRRLARRDAVLKQLIGHVGPCTLRHDPDGFGVVVRSIISQQISTKAARAIGTRLKQSLAPAGINPRAVLAAPEEALRAAGLS